MPGPMFLQGLLLHEPSALEPKFAALAAPIAALRAVARQERCPCLQCCCIPSCVIRLSNAQLVGVTTAQQWRELADGLAEQLFSLQGFVYSSPPIIDERLLYSVPVGAAVTEQPTPPLLKGTTCQP